MRGLGERLEIIQRLSGAAELTSRVYRINSEPPKIELRVVNYNNEVFQKSVYLSWLLRISLPELWEFAEQYLR